MIHFNCLTCGKELSEPGAITFAPPGWGLSNGDTRLVQKDHICPKCWDIIWQKLMDMEDYIRRFNDKHKLKKKKSKN